MIPIDPNTDFGMYEQAVPFRQSIRNVLRGYGIPLSRAASFRSMVDWMQYRYIPLSAFPTDPYSYDIVTNTNIFRGFPRAVVQGVDVNCGTGTTLQQFIGGSGNQAVPGDYADRLSDAIAFGTGTAGGESIDMIFYSNTVGGATFGGPIRYVVRGTGEDSQGVVLYDTGYFGTSGSNATAIKSALQTQFQMTAQQAADHVDINRQTGKRIANRYTVVNNISATLFSALPIKNVLVDVYRWYSSDGQFAVNSTCFYPGGNAGTPGIGSVFPVTVNYNFVSSVSPVYDVNYPYLNVWFSGSMLAGSGVEDQKVDHIDQNVTFTNNVTETIWVSFFYTLNPDDPNPVSNRRLRLIIRSGGQFGTLVYEYASRTIEVQGEGIIYSYEIPTSTLKLSSLYVEVRLEELPNPSSARQIFP